MTSTYRENLIVRVKDSDKRPFVVEKQFEYHVGTYPSNERIIVHRGEHTDFATVPRLFRIFIDRVGVHSKACLVHDVIIRNRLRPRHIADSIFFEAMTVSKVPAIRKWVMYLSARVFGIVKDLLGLPPAE